MCLSDPRIPVETLRSENSKRRSTTSVAPLAVELATPGELPSLAAATGTGLLLLALGSLATAGLALLAVVLAIGAVRLRLRRNQSDALEVARDRHGEVDRLADLAAFRVGVARPRVFVCGDEEPNAYTIGFWGEHHVLLTTALLDFLEPHEVLFVLGHEMGHVRREHVSWLTLTAPPSSALRVPVLSFLLGLLFRDWQLRAELAADRAGLLAARDLGVAISALKKVTLRSVGQQPAAVADEGSESRDPLDRLSEYTGTHPSLRNRVAKLSQFATQLRERGLL